MDVVVTPPVVLVVGGSDSSGGAGVQADLRTLAAHRIHATTALTVVTAQDSSGVRAAQSVPAELVAAQIDTVLDDLPVAAVKTGMLASPDIIAVVADRARAGRLPHLVVDPVLVDRRGRALVDQATVELVLSTLVPHARVVTPNLDEARLLVPGTDATVDGMYEAATALGAAGAECVVVKGGRLAGDRSPDICWRGGSTRRLPGVRIHTANDHGTGCSLASAVAAGLARGDDPDLAVDRAKAFVTRAIAGAVEWQLGSGHGPIDHLDWSG